MSSTCNWLMKLYYTGNCESSCQTVLHKYSLPHFLLLCELYIIYIVQCTSSNGITRAGGQGVIGQLVQDGRIKKKWVTQTRGCRLSQCHDFDTGTNLSWQGLQNQVSCVTSALCSVFVKGLVLVEVKQLTTQRSQFLFSAQKVLFFWHQYRRKITDLCTVFQLLIKWLTQILVNHFEK